MGGKSLPALDVLIGVDLTSGIHRFSGLCATLMSIYYLILCICAADKTGIAGIITRGVFLY